MVKKFLKKIVRLSGVDVTRYDKDLDHYRKLYDKYHDHTMIHPEVFIANLDLASRFTNIKGSIVECGVWRGGMIAALAESIKPSRRAHLFDSFQGLPPAKEIDGDNAITWQKNPASETYNNCTAEMAYAVDAMKLAGHSDHQLYQGWFNDTLHQYNGGPIAILRLDGDWYDSIMECMDKLFPLVEEGGLIIVDDYYTWDGCSKAIHDYLSKIKSPSRIHQWNGMVPYIIKRTK